MVWEVCKYIAELVYGSDKQPDAASSAAGFTGTFGWDLVGYGLFRLFASFVE